MSSTSIRPTAPIISRPDRVPQARRTFWGAVTAIFWVAYVYLWMPLITLVLWFLGIKQGYAELYLRDNSIDPFILIALPVMALIATVMLVSWAEYNRLRFSGTDRRSAMDDMPLDAVAQRIGAPSAMADALQEAKIATLHMDDDATPRSMTSMAAGASPSLVARN